MITRNRILESVRRLIICSVVFVLVTATVPWRWTARNAKRWYRNDDALQISLGKGVARWIEGSELHRDNFTTGSDQFDGEWLFGSYLMAGIGFGQLISLHPGQATSALPLMEKCIARILEDDVRAFDSESWKSDPIETLDSLEEHHAAYLGYFNILLGLFRLHAPDNDYAALHDQITASLIARLEHSSIGLLLTYPDEVYPVDNCAVVGSIGLHALATGADHDAMITKWVANCRRRYLDPETGLLIQAVSHTTGDPTDVERGSGTALGSFFINFADAQLSADLTASLRKYLFGTMMGFGGVREYQPEAAYLYGDIDSGPILFGYGLSATGFALSGARTHGDYPTFRRLFATAWGAGAPLKTKGGLNFITGASLGDAILFAMLTAHPIETLRRAEVAE